MRLLILAARESILLSSMLGVTFLSLVSGGRWYPVFMGLHRFFIAISRAVVNHDGDDGTAPDHPVWSAGSLPKRRRLVLSVRNHAMLPGPASFCSSQWFYLLSSAITAEDVGAWPYSVGILVKWVAFLGTLHWPADGADLGVGGFLMLKCLFSLSFGLVRGLFLSRLFPGIVGQGSQFQCRLFFFFGPGIDIWRSCWFIGALLTSLSILPGGVRRFAPCTFGADHCRLRHIGCEKSGHGLTSRPGETASEAFLNELLILFRYPPRSALALMGGALPLRYCAVRFASWVPTWRLPTDGGVANLVTEWCGG